jgi:hypothetical protein
MQRRNFLKNTSLAGLTIAAGTLVSYNEKQSPVATDFPILETTID